MTNKSLQLLHFQTMYCNHYLESNTWLNMITVYQAEIWLVGDGGIINVFVFCCFRLIYSILFVFSVFRHFCKLKTEMNFIYSQFNLYFTVWNKRNMLEIYCAHRNSHLYTVNRNGFSISHFGLILQRILFKRKNSSWI